MKRIFLVLAVMSGMAACKQEQSTSLAGSQNTPSALMYYGEKFDTGNAMTGQQLKEKMLNTAEMNVVVSGKVADVCKKEGCWLNLDMGDNSVMQVRMKDHAFKVPVDCDGRFVVIKGRAYMDTTAVEDLRHYAEDEGRSQAEIEAITQPKVEMVFEATGVAL